MNKKEKKKFEVKKKEMLISLLNKENFKPQLLLKTKFQYLTNDNVEKMKCIDEYAYRLGKKELFIQGLPRR